jgi:hypothetical protein
VIQADFKPLLISPQSFLIKLHFIPINSFPRPFPHPSLNFSPPHPSPLIPSFPPPPSSPLQFSLAPPSSKT